MMHFSDIIKIFQLVIMFCLNESQKCDFSNNTVCCENLTCYENTVCIKAVMK